VRQQRGVALTFLTERLGSILGGNGMSSTEIGLLVFACAFGAALLGIFLRQKLPPEHLEEDSKDVVKLVMGLVATMAALVLGLLISTANTSFNQQESEIQQLGVRLSQLDRILVQFGPEGAQARAMLRTLVAADLERTWPTDARKAAVYAPVHVRALAEQLYERIATLSPTSDLERLDQTRALGLLSSIGETRRLMSEQSQGSLSWHVLFVLVCWLVLLFFGFGLFARFNATVVAALLAGALSVATACLLILDMNQPYSGWVQISSAPLREALAQMSD
jgi:hypothetical protein